MAFCLREKRSIPFITSSRCALSLEYSAAKSDLGLLLLFIVGSDDKVRDQFSRFLHRGAAGGQT